MNAATVGKLDATELRPGTPNKMLYTNIPATQVPVELRLMHAVPEHVVCMVSVD